LDHLWTEKRGTETANGSGCNVVMQKVCVDTRAFLWISIIFSGLHR